MIKGGRQIERGRDGGNDGMTKGGRTCLLLTGSGSIL